MLSWHAGAARGRPVHVEQRPGRLRIGRIGRRRRRDRDVERRGIGHRDAGDPAHDRHAAQHRRRGAGVRVDRREGALVQDADAGPALGAGQRRLAGAAGHAVELRVVAGDRARRDRRGRIDDRPAGAQELVDGAGLVLQHLVDEAGGLVVHHRRRVQRGVVRIPVRVLGDLPDRVDAQPLAHQANQPRRRARGGEQPPGLRLEHRRATRARRRRPPAAASDRAGRRSADRTSCWPARRGSA